MKREDIVDEEDYEEESDEVEEIHEEKKSHKLLNIIILLAILIVLIFVYAKYVGTKGLIVKEYRVESSVLSYNFSGVKIVHFSDVLYKSTFDSKDLDNLVKKINLLKPDLIVFTGDLSKINYKLKNEDIDYLTEKLSSLNATIGKYAIYGDQDYSSFVYDKIMEDSNFILLNNSYDEIFNESNESIYIVGLPSSIKETVNLDEAFSFYNDLDRKFIIVLVHDGNTIKYIDESNYETDLILGGHSLNGSIFIPYIGGLLSEGNTYKYSSEEYEKGITKIFISSGLGTDKYGYRLFNKPSFNLYRLKALSN